MRNLHFPRLKEIRRVIVGKNNAFFLKQIDQKHSAVNISSHNDIHCKIGTVAKIIFRILIVLHFILFFSFDNTHYDLLLGRFPRIQGNAKARRVL